MSTEPWVLFRSKTGKANASAPTTADAAVTTANMPGRCFLTLQPERKSNKSGAKEEVGTTKGRAQRQKRWWYKGRIDACINTNTMECWTNLDKNCIKTEDIDHIKSSWECEEEKMSATCALKRWNRITGWERKRGRWELMAFTAS